MRLGKVPTDIHGEAVAERPACLVQQQTGEMLIVPREQAHEPSSTKLTHSGLHHLCTAASSSHAELLLVVFLLCFLCCWWWCFFCHAKEV